MTDRRCGVDYPCPNGQHDIERETGAEVNGPGSSSNGREAAPPLSDRESEVVARFDAAEYPAEVLTAHGEAEMRRRDIEPPADHKREPFWPWDEGYDDIPDEVDTAATERRP